MISGDEVPSKVENELLMETPSDRQNVNQEDTNAEKTVKQRKSDYFTGPSKERISNMEKLRHHSKKQKLSI